MIAIHPQGRRPYSSRVSSETKQTLRTVEVEEVVDGYAGGSQSICAVAKIDGKKLFLKSSRPNGNANYANFEADLLAQDMFELAGILAPEAEVVKLRKGPLTERLGSVVLATSFVDSKFAGGRVYGGSGGKARANKDDYLKMTIIDILMGNADRRGPNFFDVETRDGSTKPVPIDNDSGFGNLANWKEPNNHCNFIKSYHGAGSTPGIRQAGTIANILIDTSLHRTILDEPEERDRTLRLAVDYCNQLTDETIDAFVEKLPREIIPRGTQVILRPEIVAEDTQKLLENEVDPEMKGAELFNFRKQQLKETLQWRRDHLVGALEDFFSQVDDPSVDPLKECDRDWKLMVSTYQATNSLGLQRNPPSHSTAAVS